MANFVRLIEEAAGTVSKAKRKKGSSPTKVAAPSRVVTAQVAQRSPASGAPAADGRTRAGHPHAASRVVSSPAPAQHYSRLKPSSTGSKIAVTTEDTGPVDGADFIAAIAAKQQGGQQNRRLSWSARATRALFRDPRGLLRAR